MRVNSPSTHKKLVWEPGLIILKHAEKYILHLNFDCNFSWQAAIDIVQDIKYIIVKNRTQNAGMILYVSFGITLRHTL